MARRRWLDVGLCVALGVFSLGCAADEAPEDGGEVPDPPEEHPVLSSPECQAPRVFDSPLRRLTNAEYRNTLEALGLPRTEIVEVTASLPSEPVSLGFRNGARTLNVDTLMAQQYADIASEFRHRLAPTCETDESDRQCVRGFVVDLGRSLFRRPLTDEEVQGFLVLYDRAQEGGDSREEATAWIVEAMLQSPDFLYRVEIPEAEVAPVTGYEMASRLAYTLWLGPPDEELLQAAAAGELETPDDVQVQAKRMLADGRALRVYEFFEQWLDLDELVQVDRDPDLYPDIPSNLALLLRTESEAFLTSLLGRGDGTFEELLTADYTFANQSLAEHYGLSGPDGAAFERVDAPGRSGILTQAMLAVQDGTTRTSIVRRGLKIRTDFLCQLVPAPPDTVNLTLDGIGEDMTQAERLELHRDNTSCAACHRLMDPIGVTFEGFDAVGRKRTQDEFGAPVATGGEVDFTADLDGEYGSVAELARAMAQSREVQQCYLTQNFRFFFGREPDEGDRCSQAQLEEFFDKSGQSLAELFIGLTRTDAFLYKAGLDQAAAESGGN